MATGGIYWEGTTVRVTGTFTVSGTATDPSTVTLKVRDPAGTETTYTYALSQVAKSATGVYYKDLSPTILTSTGTWIYRWIGTGDAAGAGEASFHIRPSAID